MRRRDDERDKGCGKEATATRACERECEDVRDRVRVCGGRKNERRWIVGLSGTRMMEQRERERAMGKETACEGGEKTRGG